MAAGNGGGGPAFSGATEGRQRRHKPRPDLAASGLEAGNGSLLGKFTRYLHAIYRCPVPNYSISAAALRSIFQKGLASNSCVLGGQGAPGAAGSA